MSLSQEAVFWLHVTGAVVVVAVLAPFALLALGAGRPLVVGATVILVAVTVVAAVLALRGE